MTDTMPIWFAVPAIAVAWGVWFSIRIAEVREEHRRFRDELAWRRAVHYWEDIETESESAS